MLNAQEILEKKFEKSAFGYRSDEVDDYLQELSAAFDKLQNEKIQMERKLEVLAEKIEEYRADEDNMRAAILDARKLGSSIVKDAQRQADEIIADLPHRHRLSARHAGLGAPGGHRHPD